MRLNRRFAGLSPALLAAPAGGPTYDADALAYFAAHTDPTPTTVKDIVNTLVLALKSAGVWSKLGGFTLGPLHHEQAARVDLRVPARVATAFNAPAFTAYRGFSGDNVAAYLDLGFTYSEAALYALDSGTVYEYIDAGTSNGKSGSGTNGSGTQNRVYAVIPATGDETFRHNDTVLDILRAATGSPIGRRALVRDGAEVKKAYFNGALVATLTTASANLPGANATLFRRGGAYSDARVPAHAHGAALSATEVAALDAATEAAVSALKGLG